MNYKHFKNNKGYFWTLVGELGAVHIWGSSVPEVTKDLFDNKFYGGVEVHYKTKPDYLYSEEAPIKDCWLTGCECWPDGSSLYFEEHLAHWVEHHHEGFNVDYIMESELADWYKRNFGDLKRLLKNGMKCSFLIWTQLYMTAISI